MAKQKTPIAKYKIGNCITCNRQSVPIAAGRCINHPYCYGKHRAMINTAKAKERGTGAENKLKSPIKKISDKKAKIDAVYNASRKIFLSQNKHCKAVLKDCTFLATQVHHLFSGASRSKYYLDMTTWLPVCANCHSTIHDKLTKDEAIMLGLKRVE